MSKINIDINYIKTSLEKIGYIINEIIERENCGINWQIKFTNSDAIITVYDTNNKKNTVVNGKPEDGEKEALKELVDKLKCKELLVDPINEKIINLIDSHKEDTYYDFKKEFYESSKDDMVHDILCLSNNTENRESYLIFGVADNYNVVGIDKEIKSNDVFDFIRTLDFAGGHVPEIEIKHLYYKYKKIAVLICKSSKYVPFYLNERYKKVNQNQIYTRFGDTNTPVNGNASYNDVEKLWRIHFSRENE